jgi:hypothetical protein
MTTGKVTNLRENTTYIKRSAPAYSTQFRLQICDKIDTWSGLQTSVAGLRESAALARPAV